MYYRSIKRNISKLYTEGCTFYYTSHNIIRLTRCEISPLKSLCWQVLYFPTENN